MSEDLLKGLAALTGSELLIYSKRFRRQDKQSRSEGKGGVKTIRIPKNSVKAEKLKLAKKEAEAASSLAEKDSGSDPERDNDDDDDDDDDDGGFEKCTPFYGFTPFNYETFAQNFPTLCEADFELSKAQKFLKQEEQSDEDKESEYESDDFSSSDGFESSDLNDESNNDQDQQSDYSEEELPALTATELEFNETSPKFLESLEKVTKLEEIYRRIETSSSLRAKWVEDLFNRPLMEKVLEKKLLECRDSFIEEKMKMQFRPMVTLKAISEFYTVLRQHLYRITLESDAIISQMDAIYSRARVQTRLADISADFRRLRQFKRDIPTATLKDVLANYNNFTSKPQFLNRFKVSDEVVREACRRIGAETYGISPEFATILDSINDDEIRETLPDDYNILKRPPVPKKTYKKSKKNATTPPAVDLENVDKLQETIRRILEAKLAASSAENNPN